MKLVLFDIDGTLIYCDGAGRTSMSQAIQSVFGFEGIPKHYSLAGATDKQILKDVLMYYGLEEEEINLKMDLVLDEYVENLKVNTTNGNHKKVLLKGVLPLLEKLSSINDKVLLGLLTGNLKKSALHKLSLFSLQSYFMHNGDLFGGFGSDHYDRSELVNICIERAFYLNGKIYVGKDVVVIGDTKNDILCGKNRGVKSIAVATGEYSIEDLLKYEPDFVFQDFSDTDKIIEAILS